MEQYSSQINNENSSYFWPNSFCCDSNQNNIQDSFSNQNYSEPLTKCKNSLFDTTNTVFEPEYFLNIQHLNKTKINEQQTCSSLLNNNGFSSIIDQSEDVFYYFHQNEVETQSAQNDNSFSQSQDQEEQQLHQSQLQFDHFNQYKNELENNSKQIKAEKPNFEQKNNAQENLSQHQKIIEIKKNDRQSQLGEIGGSEQLYYNKYSINTQNSLKNIIFAFLSSFKQMRKSEVIIMNISQFLNIKKQFIRYMKYHSFNYSVLKYITTHKMYKLFLLNYLESESDEWLSKSKVIDKQEVKSQIIFLKQCIKDNNLLDQIFKN